MAALAALLLQPEISSVSDELPAAFQSAGSARWQTFSEVHHDHFGEPPGGLAPRQPTQRGSGGKSASLDAAEMGFRFFSSRASLSSCDEGDFAEAASVDEIAGLASISSRTSTILSAGGIARENGFTVARTFGTETKQKRSTTTGLTLVS
jgi:hypothetical protein